MKRRDVVVEFIQGLAAYKADVRNDAKRLMDELTVDILLDEQALADFLTELSETILRKHLLDDNGRIRKEPAKLIRGYVRGMVPRGGDNDGR